jgi:hypothetical protein
MLVDMSFKQIARIWKRFRLITASVILSNLTNKTILLGDIQAIEHFFELCDQYSLRILINWIAQKNNFPVYTKNIESESKNVLGVFETWLSFWNQYPFYDYRLIDIPKEEFDQAFQFLEDNIICQIDLIASLYEHILSYGVAIGKNGSPYILAIENGRSQGQFYTPNWVIRYCYELSSLKTLKDKKQYKILDPSCGAGKFLLGALDYLSDNDITESEKANIAKNNLYGFDIDARAVSLTCLSLMLSLSKHWQNVLSKNSIDKLHEEMEFTYKKLTKNIMVKDSVVSSANKENSFCSQFDLVITNPPYISFGARNQARLSDNWSRYLRQNFKEAAQYKIRLHSIFQDVALRMARTNGEVILFLPDAFLTGSFYANLRKLILNQTKILSFTELPDKTMSEACVGRWCISHYMKVAENNYGENNYDINLFKINTNESNDREIENYVLPKDVLVSKDKNRFQLVFNHNDRNILQSLSELPNLGNYLSGHTGIRARSGKHTIISSSRKFASHKRGILSGAQVTRHLVIWNNKWINVVPEKLYGGGFDTQIIENPKLLVRQTGDRIIAAVDLDGLYHLNNVHSFALLKPEAYKAEDKMFALYFYVGLMNSTFWLYLYQLKSREAKRQLAQIDIEMLESMPVTISKQDICEQIAKISIQLGFLYKNDLLDKVPDLEASIDNLVYQLYDLLEPEINYIEGKMRENPSISNSQKLVKLLTDNEKRSLIDNEKVFL